MARKSAADQWHDEQRDQRRETEQAHHRSRVREGVDLVRDGDDADLGADRRNRLSQPQVAEIAVLERSRIDAQAPEQLGDHLGLDPMESE